MTKEDYQKVWRKKIFKKWKPDCKDVLRKRPIWRKVYTVWAFFWWSGEWWIGRNPAKKWRVIDHLKVSRGKRIHLAVQVVNMSIGPSSWRRQLAEQFGLEIVCPSYPSCRVQVGWRPSSLCKISWGWIYQAHAGLDIGDTTVVHACQACSGSDSPSFEKRSGHAM